MTNSEKFSLNNLLNSLFQKLKPQILQDQSRPAELPLIAPDCGWNHCKQKESPAMRESIIEINKSELINPLSDKIPNIVWEDLLHSEKLQIIEAFKLQYKITYFHTERHPKENNPSILTTNGLLKEDFIKSIFEDDGNFAYDRSQADTDVIKIIEYDSKSKEKLEIYGISYIYSRATSERGITKLDNPVTDIIPHDIWNNLPDVLKEKIIEKNNYYEKHKDYYNFNISYSPDENTICIGHGNFRGGGYYTENYDAKRGIYIDGTKNIA